MPNELVKNKLLLASSYFLSGVSATSFSNSPSRWLIQSALSLGVMRRAAAV